MKIKSQSRFCTIYFLFAIFLLFGCIGYSVPTLAQNKQPTVNTPQNGSSRGRPTRRQGTGSRNGECAMVKIPLTALVAANSTNLAIEEYPTFWFFLPYSSNQATSGEFSLQDEANNDIYRTSFQVPEKPGIISVSIPSNLQPLELNKNYRWHLKISCKSPRNQIAKNASDFVFGWMQRVGLESDLANKLKTVDTLRGRIELYKQNGMWQSALTEFNKLRTTQVQNIVLTNEWGNLLKAMGLEDLAQQSIFGEVKGF